MNVYFDNGATTMPLEGAVLAVQDVCNDVYGNPSSVHKMGFYAEKKITEAREIIAKTLKVDKKEIVFTSGGTESNNMALNGIARANIRRGKHIITTKYEHASVYNPLINLEESGYEVTYVDVDDMGHINLDMLKKSLRKDTILVSVMMVNNEIGSVNDIKAVSDIVKSFNKQIYIHVDAIQAYGKFRIFPEKLGIDLLSVSAHKIHGIKGCGFIYIKDKTKIKPLIYGGGQEKNLRSGTENVPGIVALSYAADYMYKNIDTHVEHLYQLKSHFINKIKTIDGTIINAVSDDIRSTAPHIVSVSFEGIKSEVLLHALEEKGIYVSAGSACSSNHPAISGTLKAIGVKKELLDSTLRFSFSILNTISEVNYCIETLEELLPTLRRFYKK
ncbi:MAG: cysteine desulfurase [Lachnospiraceae bacterium]|nr:cysteine desulfurase [Lachnospiraceae bacterium]